MFLSRVKLIAKFGVVALSVSSVLSSCTSIMNSLDIRPVKSETKNNNVHLKYDPTLTSDNSSLKAQKDVEFLKLINSKRESCGFGSLKADINLSKAAFKHTEYLRYIDEQRPISTIMGATPYYGYDVKSDYKYNSPHIQQKIKGLESITGQSNPYFFAKTAKQRVAKAGYKGFYNGDEVIAAPNPINEFVRKYRKSDKSQFEFLLHGLLSVPYHTSAILNPFHTDAGVSYSLHGVNVNSESKGGYHDRFAHMAVVEFGGFRDNIEINDSNNGLLTYPCEGSRVDSATMQAEEPNPLKSKALRDSVGSQGAGQPIYIVGLDPKTRLALKNIKLIERRGREESREIDTFVLSANNDPHGILKKNESFIIPLSNLTMGSSYLLSFESKTSNGVPFKRELTFYY